MSLKRVLIDVPPVLQLGPRIREAREERGLSLRDVAEVTGFSVSFLSQVELGRSSPSLASLQTICAALGLELAAALRQDPPGDSGPVHRAGHRARVRSDWSRAFMQSLLPVGVDPRLSAVVISLDPGGHTGQLPVPPKTRQLAYCQNGSVVMAWKGATHELGRGDVIVLDGASASWKNVGTEQADLLIVTARVR